MSHLLSSLLTLSLFFSISNVYGHEAQLHPQAEAVSAVKAAELACHRIDRLVMLKKIDKSYLAKFQKLEVVVLPAKDPSGAAYSVTTYQTAPTSGVPLSLTIAVDATGKVINHQVNAGGVAGPDVSWTGKDPVSLTEAGLHYVLDEHVKNEELRPFAISFQSLTLTQRTAEGVTTAVLQMNSSATTAKLVLTLDLSGKLLSKEVIP